MSLFTQAEKESKPIETKDAKKVETKQSKFSDIIKGRLF